VVADLYDQPQVAFIKFLAHGNVTLNESINSSRVMCSKNPWMMGWIMGRNKACPNALMFCSKD